MSTHPHACLHAQMLTHIHTPTYLHMRTHAHAQKHPGIQFCSHTLIYALLLTSALTHTSIFTHAHFHAHPLAYISKQMLSTGNPVSWKKKNVFFLPIKIHSILQSLSEVLPLLGLSKLSRAAPQPSLSPGFGSPRPLWAQGLCPRHACSATAGQDPVSSQVSGTPRALPFTPSLCVHGSTQPLLLAPDLQPHLPPGGPAVPARGCTRLLRPHS